MKNQIYDDMRSVVGNVGSIVDGLRSGLDSVDNYRKRQSDLIQYEIDRMRSMWSPLNEIQFWKGEFDRLNGQDYYRDFVSQTYRAAAGIAAMGSVDHDYAKNITDSFALAMRSDLVKANASWDLVQKNALESLHSVALGSVASQISTSRVLNDVLGSTASYFWADQEKGVLGHGLRGQSAYEKILNDALQNALGTRAFDDILDELREPSPELQQEVVDAASSAFLEPTPEGAFRKFVSSLEGLDPLKKFFLIVIIGPLFVGLVLSVVNPVADHYVKKWLNDSPQGAEKQAVARVVSEAGGVAILADFRLVTARNTLNVRESPAALGKKMGSLSFGTLVRYVREEKDFTLVEWRGDDGAVMKGWVFSIYLKKIK